MNYSEYFSLKKESEEDRLKNVKFARADAGKDSILITIDELVHKKIMYWIDKSNFEVSGLGNVIYDQQRNELRVIDAILLQQENTSSTTELDGQAISKAMYYMHRNKVPGELRWWWHSHVNMNVFWSGTDVTALKTLGGGLSDGHTNPSWFCATVFNKRRECLSAFVQNHPVPIILSKLQTQINQDIPADLMAQWNKEYDENVEIKNYTVTRTGSGRIYRYGQQQNHSQHQSNLSEEDPWATSPFWERKKEEEESESVVEVTDEDVEELDFNNIDDLMLAHENGEITTDEFLEFINTIQKESDSMDLLSDEAAAAIDAENGITNDDEILI